MDLAKELKIMQKNYAKNPLPALWLACPDWLNRSDPLFHLYRDMDLLLKKGTVTMACIVQANEILFRSFPHTDHPANILYSTDTSVLKNRYFLQHLSYQLFSYKHMPRENVPNKYRRIADILANELDRSCDIFSVDTGLGAAEMHFAPILIFRELLPLGKICGQHLPILTVPETETVLVLPKKYWSAAFKLAWCFGKI
jgi:hypothetical protein